MENCSTTGPRTEGMDNQICWKHLEIKGNAMSNQKEFRYVMKLVFKGNLNPIIDRIFPLVKAREAERYLGEGTQFGIVLLEIS